MKDFFEGSVSTIGDSEWTEPHDVTAMTHELAAIEVLASHADCHAVELQQEMDVCVRQVTVEGDPLSEWRYFRGKAWAVSALNYESMKTTETPETDKELHAVQYGGSRFSFPEHARRMERERNEARKELRALVAACNEYGGGASISHPRYTRQLSAAKKFLENDQVEARK